MRDTTTDTTAIERPEFIPKTPEELEVMRYAGKHVARVLLALAKIATPGRKLSALNKLAGEMAEADGGRPAVRDYREGNRQYPNNVCLSVNAVVLHGVPQKDYKLRSGDVLKIDYVFQYKGLHADAAVTVPVGEVCDEHMRLITATAKSLGEAIKAVAAYKNSSWAGHAIQAVALNSGFAVDSDYGGHGIGYKMHEKPFVSNSPFDGGVSLLPGHTICIEPIFLTEKCKLKVMRDGWSVMAPAGVGAHFEHTIAITEEGAEVLTEWDPEMWGIVAGAV